jgi:hypothetical protein
MADADHIRFRFEHGDLEVEISGPRSFVESLSREVMRDVGDVVQPEAPSGRSSRTDESTEIETSGTSHSDHEPSSQPSAPSGRIETPHTPATQDPDVVWLIRNGPLMQRIFMSDVSVVESSTVGRLLRGDALHTLFATSESFDRVFGEVASESSTVWGKLTDAGKKRMDQTDTDPR